MYAVKVDQPNLPKGADVEISGVGLFTNGETTIVTDEEAEAFRVANSTQETAFNSAGNLVSTTVQGPTLLQALNGKNGIEVSVHKEDLKDSDARARTIHTQVAAPPVYFLEADVPGPVDELPELPVAVEAPKPPKPAVKTETKDDKKDGGNS